MLCISYLFSTITVVNVTSCIVKTDEQMLLIASLSVLCVPHIVTRQINSKIHYISYKNMQIYIYTQGIKKKASNMLASYIQCI